MSLAAKSTMGSSLQSETAQPSPAQLPEELVRVIQNALAAHYREHLAKREDDKDRVMKPRLNLFESTATNTMVATLELPGLQKSDVQIAARNNELTVSGERRPLAFAEGSGRTVVNELKYGKFMRTIQLPPGTEPTRISASMDDGMLTICWPLPNFSERDNSKQITVA